MWSLMMMAGWKSERDFPPAYMDPVVVSLSMVDH